MKVLGIPDRFIEHRSSPSEQHVEVGIDSASVERVVRGLTQPTRV